MLDAEALAIAFMADGWRTKDKRWENSKPAYRLALDSHTYGDVLLMKNSIKEKLSFDFNINKKGKGYALNLPTKHSARFEETMAPHIFDSFKYKLGR